MKQKNFYDHYVSTHYQYVAAENDVSFQKRYYVWKSYLEKHLPDDKSSEILEIGAGVGHNLSALKKLGYKNITGTDYSPECVANARKKGYDMKLVSERSEKSFYLKNKNTYEMVLLYDVIEHYSPGDAVSLLTDVKKILKKNGCVLISLPNADHPFSNTLMFADVTHKFIYNEKSLSQLLRNSGFFSNTFTQMNSITFYDDNMVIQILKKVFVPVFAGIGELFWRGIALSQGIFLPECKPTLIAVARK